MKKGPRGAASAAPLPTKARRSGAEWSEDDYAAHGYGRISLRLRRPALDELAKKAEAAGLSRSEFLALAIAGFTCT